MVSKNGRSDRVGDSHGDEDDLSERIERSKRKRDVHETNSLQQSTSSADEASSETSSAREPPPKKLRRVLSHISTPGPAYPRSAYDGWPSPLPLVSESEALTDLKATWDSKYASASEQPAYTYFTLEDFSIYRLDHPRHAHELTTLDRLQNRNGCNEFLFDGTLTFGNERRYVQEVRFKTMAIDGYGDPDITDLHDHICIQSSRANGREIWYQLGKPSTVYNRFWTPFFWLAKFTKYFVDYLLEFENVTLDDFRSHFYPWLDSRCRDCPSFQSWLRQCCLRDFRTSIAVNVGFLWKECNGIDDLETGLCEQPIWGEVDPFRLTAIPKRENRERATIVTPFAYECFKNMYFAQHLESREFLDPSLKIRIQKRKRQLKLTPLGASEARGVALLTPRSMPDNEAPEDLVICKGDVVCLEADTRTEWKKSSTATWYAYVQAVKRSPKTKVAKLDVVWLYEPSDTTLGKSYYPFQNELFFSDNCDCGKSAIDADCVISIVDVSWFVKDPSSVSGYFVRQKFRTKEDDGFYDFVSLKQSDFDCGCSTHASDFEECRSKYQIGDSVLVKEYSHTVRQIILEPAQIVDFNLSMRLVVLRRLIRKRATDPDARANELVLTEETFNKPPEEVIRKYNLRFYAAEDVKTGLPTPYDRNGTGDFYFIKQDGGLGGKNIPMEREGAALRGDTALTSRQEEYTDDNVMLDDSSSASDAGPTAHQLQRMMSQGRGVPRSIIRSRTFTFKSMDLPGSVGPMDNKRCLPSMRTSWDPTAPSSFKKLKGMGIFCGGGNFDRGIEEGGAVEFKYAVDWAERALHSYRANVRAPDEVQFFLGSVNDYMAQAIAGSKEEYIARIGGVDFIGAGSPCPGFSMLQKNPNSPESLRNASMVASVVSFVDFYSPAYILLENVVSMTHGMGANKDENVFAQILAAFVALGYQVQQFHEDAWSHGGSESRSRVFVCATAPGLDPLPMPQPTHAHPTGAKVLRKALGKATNGLPFGERRDYYTPFLHVTPAESTKDLPNIADGQPFICPAFSDHRTPSEESGQSRARIAAVPVRPRGMGIIQTARRGLLSGEPLEYCNRLGNVRKRNESKTYSRVDPDGLFPTVTTALRINDGVTGRTLHWDEQRSLTVMELRRAQGVLDHEVVLGSPVQQVVIIGNGVERNVALVLGLALRESWSSSYSRISTDDLYDVQVCQSSPATTRGSSNSPRESHRPSSSVSLSQEERERLMQNPHSKFRIINEILEGRARHWRIQ